MFKFNGGNGAIVCDCCSKIIKTNVKPPDKISVDICNECEPFMCNNYECEPIIYLVSNQLELFFDDTYTYLSIEDSLKLIESFDVVQFDTETSGKDPHVNTILCAQFGNKAQNKQIVVDTSTVSIIHYKNLLETKLLIGHNLKFDLQFLYNYEIVPLNVWDTMIIEQLLHLGYNNKFFRYSLQAVAQRRLGIDIDKTTRGEIIWRGLDASVIKYAAGDVVYLEDIREQQIQDCKTKKCTNGSILENGFVPVIAYLEWCGIRLDVNKWKKKIEDNELKIIESTKNLNNWVSSAYKKNKISNKFVTIQTQGDLFSGFDVEPKCNINWASSKQVIPFLQHLGFDTKTEDKKTGESKDSAVEKLISKQKGIADDFLKYYFEYKASTKDASTYGQNYIDAINPNTDRIHTVFKQLGAASGRMSCGDSRNPNRDLAALKNIVPSRCKYVQLQNLPSDEITRSSFIPKEGNTMASCDYAALESRLGADIYNEQSMIEEYLYGSGDIHSLTAKHCFKKELENILVKDIKKLRPDLRKRAKPVEFSQQFGGSAKAIQNSLGCTLSEAKEIAAAYNEGFKGISEFKVKGSYLVRNKGYVLICKKTGHKLYWEDWKKWKMIENMPEQLRLREYTSDEIKEHNMAASKWDRMALNAPTQGTGIIILKYSMILFFKWILKENLFNKVLLCNLVHDEVVIEYPNELNNTVPNKLSYFMEKGASVFCEKLPIPAVPDIGDHWIH